MQTQEQEGILPPYASLSEATPTETQQVSTVHAVAVTAPYEQTGLCIGHNGWLVLDGQPVQCLSQSDDLSHLLCYTSKQEKACRTIGAGDLLAAAYTSGYAQHDQQNLWLSAFVRARAALSEVLTLYAVTSVCTVLSGIKGSDDFLEAIEHARVTFSRISTQFENDETLFATCICLAMQIGALYDDFERGNLSPCLLRVRGGRIFLEAMQQVHEVLMQLPLHPPVYQACAEAPTSGIQYTPARRSVIDKREEYEPLREEILKQIDWQQALFLSFLTVGGIFLSLALQPGVSGLMAMILPILGLGLAIKLAAHDLRNGQITYYLRFNLKSPWEIVRRRQFDGSEISQEERQILAEQGITVESSPDAKKLMPLFPGMHTLATRIVFVTVYATSLGIGIIRTYPDIQHHNPLSIFIWLVAFLASASTLYILQRRRVR